MASWSQRVQAVKNLPSALKILWDAGPGLVSGALFFRLFAAILPVAMLAVSRKIIEGVTPVVRGEPIAPGLWYWVAFEFSLAITGAFVGRAIGFFDSLLSDQSVATSACRLCGTLPGSICRPMKVRLSKTN